MDDKDYKKLFDNALHMIASLSYNGADFTRMAVNIGMSRADIEMYLVDNDMIEDEEDSRLIKQYLDGNFADEE